jgi:hypothetical protein
MLLQQWTKRSGSGNSRASAVNAASAVCGGLLVLFLARGDRKSNACFICLANRSRWRHALASAGVLASLDKRKVHFAHARGEGV